MLLISVRAEKPELKQTAHVAAVGLLTAFISRSCGECFLFSVCLNAAGGLIRQTVLPLATSSKPPPMSRPLRPSQAQTSGSALAIRARGRLLIWAAIYTTRWMEGLDKVKGGINQGEDEESRSALGCKKCEVEIPQSQRNAGVSF